METLDQIAIQMHTDKASPQHGYTKIYEKYLEPWRDKEFTLLEIGVASGASINMWREYFSKAKIYGIDNNPDCKGPGIYIGDQTDTIFLNSVLNEIGAPDVLIDDGWHFAPGTILTFKHLFPKIADSGLYFIEDTHCFYDSTYGLAPTYGDGMSEIFKFFTGLACDVDVHGRGMTGNTEYAINLGIVTPPVPEYSRILDSMHIHPSLWLFKRK